MARLIKLLSLLTLVSLVIPTVTEAATEDQLIAEYGLSAYNSCFYKACSGDTSDPWTRQSCNIQVEYYFRVGFCKSSKSPSAAPSAPAATCPLNAYNDNGTCKCKSGYVAYGNACYFFTEVPKQQPAPQPTMTVDQQCKQEYGPYSYGSGGSCYCSQGYQWTEDMKSCMPTPAYEPSSQTEPQLTLDQVCKRDFGGNSYWPGEMKGSSPVCNCNKGYEFSGNHCVKSAPDKTNDQICADEYGSNSVWTKELNDQGGLICGCSDGYAMDGGRCVKLALRTETNDSSSMVAQTEVAGVSNSDTDGGPGIWLILTVMFVSGWGVLVGARSFRKAKQRLE